MLFAFIKKHRSAPKKGFTLLFGVLITGLLLSMVLTIAGIVVRQLIISGVGRESQIAFYAADSALECVRYYDRRGDFDVPGTPPGSLECNSNDFLRDEVDDSVTCEYNNPSGANDEFCPENGDLFQDANSDGNHDGGIQSYRKIVYSKQNTTQLAGFSPEADFVVLKRTGPLSLADGRTTITVNGRNTSDVNSSRRVERTLKETYLPTFQCTSNLQTPTDPDTLSPNQKDRIVAIEAWRVTCNSEDAMPEISNHHVGTMTRQYVEDFVADSFYTDPVTGQSGYRCSYHPDACFEYNVTSENDYHDLDETGSGEFYNPTTFNDDLPAIPGFIHGSADGQYGDWEAFESASTIDGPAMAYVDPGEGNVVTKLRVRTLLQEGEMAFYDPLYNPFTSDYESSHVQTAVSGEFVCHADGVNFDNFEYIGEKHPGNSTFQSPKPMSQLSGESYFCVAFTAPETSIND